MSNLVNAFDFDNPDYSLPVIPEIQTPTTDSSGNFIDVSICEAAYPNQAPPPYGIVSPQLLGVFLSSLVTLRGECLKKSQTLRSRIF